METPLRTNASVSASVGKKHERDTINATFQREHLGKLLTTIKM